MKKVLIVDDDADVREVIKIVLANKYELKEAGSKKDGLKALESFQPDLIVLDVMMESVKAGFEMAREVKANPQTKNAKILMLTNVDNEFKIDYKAAAGDPDWLPVDDYIVKPVEPKSFLAKVEKLIK
jgi:CheY-like chemotaxis protein